MLQLGQGGICTVVWAYTSCWERGWMWHELVVVMVLSLVNLPFPVDTGDPAACLRSHRDNLDVSHV